MENKQKTTHKMIHILKALVLSYAITGILLLLVALLLYKFRIGVDIVSIAVAATYGLSCLAGGHYIGRKMGSRKFLWGFLAGVCYFALLLLISAFAKGQGPSVSSQMLMAMAVSVCSGTLGGMLS